MFFYYYYQINVRYNLYINETQTVSAQLQSTVVYTTANLQDRLSWTWSAYIILSDINILYYYSFILGDLLFFN